METTLYLIRHAESEMNLQGHLIGGRSNGTPLSDLGEDQAGELGLYFASNEVIPDVVVSSPAVRTLSTAAICLDAMGLNVQPVIEDAVQELDQGDWEGLPRDEIFTPELIDYVNSQEGRFRAPNGESPKDVALRMFLAIERHASEVTEGSKVFVYTHGFAIRSLVGHLNRWPHKRVFNEVTDNTSFTTLSYDGFLTVRSFAKEPF